jgi:hypothetical protein
MRYINIALILLCSCTHVAVTPPDTLIEPTIERASSFVNEPRQLCKNVVGVFNPKKQCNENYVFDQSLYHFKIDTLAQIKFWRTIMKLHEDSAIVNFANSRQVIQIISAKDWNLKNDSAKKIYKDSVRRSNQMDSTNRILITTGKKFFYDFDKTSQNFQKGIHCFIENNVDPWFAQAILLIESPNKLQKSNAGAYGSFQLMKDVARLYGLKVNRHMDERADFERSAFAASSLIKTICIPKAHAVLDSLGIHNYDENELWFKLLVMHIYHAGFYNVQNALFSFMPNTGDMSLIYNLWRAQTSRFKSASQNYSQLVLAAMLEMNERSGIRNKQTINN